MSEQLIAGLVLMCVGLVALVCMAIIKVYQEGKSPQVDYQDEFQKFVVYETSFLPLDTLEGRYYIDALDTKGSRVPILLKHGSEQSLRANLQSLPQNQLGVCDDTKKLVIRHGNSIFLVPFANISEVGDIIKTNQEGVENATKM